MAKINTIFSLQDNMSSNLNKINSHLRNTSKNFNEISGALINFNSLIQVMSFAKNKIEGLFRASNNMVSIYQYQIEQETKLETIMRKRMNATNAEIQSIKDFASAQQQLGVYGDEVILQGAQELASFTSNTEAIKTLIPAMNNLIAQQYGYSASGREFQSTADMMGKVLSGQTGALSRLGYIFSEEEKQMLKTGDEMQRASTLAKIITDNVGEMNSALKGGNFGSMQQLSNIIGDLQEEVGKLLLPFKTFFNMITSRWKIKFYESIIKALELVRKNIDKVVIVIGSLTIALGLAGIAFVALKSKAIACAVATAVAWAIANAPLFLIISLIFSITAGLSMLVIHSEKTFSKIGEFIGGFVAGFKNSMIGIRNFFAFILEEIVNGFWKAVDNVSDFFINLFANIVDMITPIAGMIGDLFHQDWASNLSNFQNKLNEIANKDPLHTIYLGRKDYVSVEEYGRIGSQKGQDYSDKIQSLLDDMKNKLDPSNFDMSTGQKFNFDNDGNLLVSDLSNKKIADNAEDLIKEMARSKFNINLNTLAPQVNMTNNINDRRGFEKGLDLFISALEQISGAF